MAHLVMKQAIIYTAKYPYLPNPHLQQIRYHSGPALSAITLIVSDGFRLISVAARWTGLLPMRCLYHIQSVDFTGPLVPFYLHRALC